LRPPAHGAIVAPMAEPNPYAPPADFGPVPSGTAGAPETNVSRQGSVALLPVYGSVFPDRCVVCNAPAGGYRLRRTLYWHHPAIYLSILGGLLVYVILATVMRKSALVELGLCERHRARRRNGLILACGGFLLALIAMFWCAWNSSAGGIFAGIGLMVVLPIAGGLLARVASPTRIDDRWVLLKVGQPFLDSLPRT
jgi:hypothetical protein